MPILQALLDPLRRIPKPILLVALYGLLLNISTQMLYSHLVLFLKFDLEVTESQIGWIDGIGEFISYLIRVFSGAISDYIYNRKLLLLLGCSICCLVKPIFSCTTSLISIWAIELMERIGSGIQASPRDALLADLADKNKLAEAFGFAKSMKTIGTIAGTSIAVLIMYLSNGNYSILFKAACVPALVAILPILKIKEPHNNVFFSKKFQNPFQKKYLLSLDSKFFTLMAFAFFCELGHFGESLITIEASRFISPSMAGITTAFMGLGQVIFAYPMGLLADNFGKCRLIKICLFLAGISYILTAISDNCCVFFASVVILCGQHASIQAIFLSMINKDINKKLRGTAIGIFYCAIGGSYMISAEICGIICEKFRYEYAFLYSSLVCFICFFLCQYLYKFK
ncbi:MAG: MFS transporter [Holosporaceae bacterium]|jgi:MFS family permease|nr:MFS transporter [Holosporaceae bacterium]